MTDETVNASTAEEAPAEVPMTHSAVAVEVPAGATETDESLPSGSTAGEEAPPSSAVADSIEVADPAAALRHLGDVADDLSAEDFAAAVERTVVQLKEGTLVTGIIVRVDPDEVLVDIGYKSEGVIPAKELSIRNSVNPSEFAKVGDPVEALVLQMEDAEGRLILSKKRAQV